MHALLRYLSRRRSTPWTRYGLTVAILAAITLFRLVVPLNVAPFLLYLPVVIIAGLVSGREAGFLATALSAVASASFFTGSEQGWTLTGPQWIAELEFIIVASGMVLVCASLRLVMIDNEIAVTRLTESQATLALARQEAEAARDAAEQANTAKSAFIANMSHELRTPLSAIIGYSEMLQEEMADGVPSADLEPDVRKIEGNARHLLGLINDVLDLSKVESGKMDVYPEAFDLEPVIRDVAATAQTLVDRKGNRLEVRIAPGLGRMFSDLTKVRQILLNLLSNAAKFTENGTVTLSVDRELFEGRDHVVFQVVDTGIGMTAEQLDKLFQRFVQADISTTRKYGGTGLGLSLTKALGEILGGSVGVESREGVGSTFTVRFPASYRTGEAPPAPDAEDVGATGGDLVLVIDDDADQRALMTKFLHREGFKVRTAADGDTGLALARGLKPRAILLDVMMPGVDGWSVLSALKADPGLADIPVVMVTFVEQRALAASLGAADYVMKPVRWDRFKNVMDRFRPPEGDALVIDDDPDSRARLRKALERDGWAVREAENGRDGLDRLDAAQPGVVLLDLTMPVMDGFKFLERMRARPDCAAVPVVVLTALDLTWEDRRRLRGASQILHKGDVSMRDLAERLHGLTATVEPTFGASSVVEGEGITS